MTIVPIHSIPSRPVESYKQIKKDAEELRQFVTTVFKGRKAIALHHSQVSTEPFNFFVFHPDICAAFSFKHWLVMNPRIEQQDLLQYHGEKKEIMEGCMSFPHRDYKRILRYTSLPVKFEVPTFFGMKTHADIVNGIIAQAFQHEIDHAKGRNLYQK